MQRRSVGHWVLHGIIGGIVAGIIFALFEMLVAGIMGMPVTAPLQLISSIILGASVLTAGITGTQLAVGIILHLVMSAIFGLIFVGLLNLGRQENAVRWRMLAYGTIFGFALWVVNFLILGSLFWPQFTTVNQLWNGFVAHTFFYGTVLGAYTTYVAQRGVRALARPEEEERRRAA